MIKMNITLGLWRLWVLLAVCWVGALTTLKFEDLTATKIGFYEADMTDGFSKQCKEAQHWIDIWLNCQKEPTQNSIKISAPMWSTRINTAKWVFLPPIGLLLLGLGISWVVKGFRRTA